MGLSRTAKILLAALLVAAAGFAWVNFFNQSQLVDSGPSPITSSPISTAPVATSPGTVVAPVGTSTDAPDAVVDAGAADGTEVGVADGEAVAVGEVDPDAVATSDGADEAAGTDAAVGSSDAIVVAEPEVPAVSISPPVVVTQAPTVVTRDLVVGDLPFLVTSPPAAEAAAVEDPAAAASRPQGAQRVSVNPFSPMIVQTPPAPSAPVLAQAEPEVIQIVTDASGQTSAPVITEVGVPTGTPTTASVAPTPEPVAAPAPRTVAPATSSAAALPRPLPSGTLPVTPEILREARAPQEVAEPPTPVDLGALAAIRVPEEPEPQEPLPTTETEAPEVAAAVATPEVLGTDRPNEPAAAATPASTVVTPTPSLPIAVGGDPLSRYLRDNNVRFTGSVLGPLSVGVFRSAQFTEPVVLTLGQPLPDTDIILSDLRGYEARFSLGDTTQTLSLDLRR